jgi:ribosomal protein S18 acetylase RimI-like enzyme
MADLDPLLRFWRALDARFERVEATPWGAVVSDHRFPAIWDVNYARVESGRDDVRLEDIDAALARPLAEVKAHHRHIVLFDPDKHTEVLVAASTRGDRLSWDVVMRLAGPSHLGDAGAIEVVEIAEHDDDFWHAVRASMREFETTDEEATRQLLRIEREVLLGAGKRWFGVRERGAWRAFGSLLVLDGIGHVDHVVTFPEARRRGFASAIVGRIAREATAQGIDELLLLCEPGGGAQRIYERLGFRFLTQIGSTLGPLSGRGTVLADGG